ncbi:hypothetical protein AOC36_08450 [Erysipelothrix larvae]|uniref:Uncharacterized protein n=1 Tax=Erysipelothrix larvae TaxID=1514105 RepID=A0A0X8H0U2_9FIRM|nr:hypothetical protein [Erysipelothrix larvae]AMC94014.1 hypothetical protein AOC36_08450 [Erysipelothrix larvae]
MFLKVFDNRKQPFIRNKSKETFVLIDNLSAQLFNVPQLIEQFTNGKSLAFNVSRELAHKISSGELEFIRKGKTGEAVGILRDALSKKTFAQLPIKEIPLELGVLIASMGLTNELQKMTQKLDELGDKINSVNRNFDSNRYAEVHAAQAKYHYALLSKDIEVKKTLYLESLSQSTNAYNLLLNQLYETKQKFRDSKENIRFFSAIKSNLEEEENVAEVALYNLNYLKDAFSLQIASLAGLKEYDALGHALQDFRTVILEEFSKEESLFLDGHLPPKYGNPFSFLSSNVIDTTTSIIEYIDNNEDLLELHLYPNTLQLRK